MSRTLLEQLEDLSRLVRTRRDEVLHSARLNSARYLVLRNLADQPRTSSAELALASGVRHQTMHETMDGLERAGLLERPGPVGPGSVRRAWLTRRGTVAIEQCRAALTEIEHAMLRRFTAEQVDLFQQFLDECTLQLRRLPRSRSGSRPGPRTRPARQP